MTLKGLLKNIFKKDIASSLQKSEGKLNVLVIGINHYDISKPEGQVLKSNIPPNTTHLMFPEVTKEEYEYLCLAGLQEENTDYKFVSKDELREKKVAHINGLDSFKIMRPQYAIVEDGRWFCVDNVPILTHEFYREAVKRTKDYQ